MISDITKAVYSDEYGTIEYQYKKTNCCPRCNAHFEDGFRYRNLFQFPSGVYRLYTVTECPACKLPFFTVYFEGFKREEAERMLFKTPISYPRGEYNTEFDPMIKEISPDFVDIYHEAEVIEMNKLDRTCGVGYRKAFEFLIKDYLCKCAPDKASAIQKNSLNYAISQIENEKIKMAASKARVLGNDHVYYIKKYEMKEIKDLKKLIHATVYWIMMEEITNQSLTP